VNAVVRAGGRTGGGEKGVDGSNKRYTGYCTDIVTDLAFEWMENHRDPDKPFFLMVQHKAPHRAFTPALRHLEMWKDEDLPEPPTLFDDYSNRSKTLKDNEMEIARHMRWGLDLQVPDFNPDNTPNSPRNEYARMNDEQKAAWDAHFGPLNARMIADYEAGKFADPKDLTRWKYQRYVKNFLRTIAAVDENVGRVLDYLEEHKLADNTIVIYSSDQGCYLGEHGWYDKRWMFEESFAMPFLIRWPGVVTPGTRVDKLIQNIDYAPTFLEIAGAQAPERMQGRSLMPLLTGAGTDWREDLYYSYYEVGEHRVAQHFGVATERYKLIHFPATDEWNLMDLVADPLEMRSFHDDPEYAGIMEMMTGRFHDARARYRASESTVPVPRQDGWWRERHQEKKNEVANRAADIDVVFVGDSITQGWKAAGKALWDKHIAPLKVLNLGYSGDRTQQVLWRIKQNEWPADLQPATAVVMIGTNNTGHDPSRPPEETADAIAMICEDIHDRSPNTRIILHAIFPRGETADDPMRLHNDRINTILAGLNERDYIDFHDISAAFLAPDGSLPKEVMPDALHPNEEGYRRWTEALMPLINGG
jgi:N-acetylglucosamine-6-sulfatase